MNREILSVVFVTSALLGCAQAEPDASEAQIATLYRNSSLMPSMRLHFGTFDAGGEANDFNINNCQMTARLLNANVEAQWTGEGKPDVGFWCEPGPFNEEGIAHASFDAAFPTDAEGNAAP